MEPFRSNSGLSGSLTPMEEKRLLRKVRESACRGSFEKLFRIYYKPLHSFAYSYVRRPAEAEDVVQAVFLRIWEQKEYIDPPGTVKQYLFASVRNEALNLLRRRRVIRENEDEVVSVYREMKIHSPSDEDQENVVLQQAIQQAIDQLPPRCRTIFLLNRRSGLTYREIAGVLDISINTVTTQMGRALQALREHLSKYALVLISLLSSALLI